jgi:hypothetical protein
MTVRTHGWSLLFRLRWFGRLPRWMRKRAWAQVNRDLQRKDQP